ncbi:hypothetical protein V2J09_021647 [Rumex salicifolius]
MYDEQMEPKLVQVESHPDNDALLQPKQPNIVSRAEANIVSRVEDKNINLHDFGTDFMNPRTHLATHSFDPKKETTLYKVLVTPYSSGKR